MRFFHWLFRRSPDVLKIKYYERSAISLDGTFKLNQRLCDYYEWHRELGPREGNARNFTPFGMLLAERLQALDYVLMIRMSGNHLDVTLKQAQFWFINLHDIEGAIASASGRPKHEFTHARRFPLGDPEPLF